ncbi:Purine catabolism protein PucG [Planctomycetes bacterium Poly30]|uniref:Purine catabolism protein PucG n=1 Tax=Saltatorellus ferox TaxID=2528018 RepID=A0A518EMQ0_9BACT|nr:Purine catabolism protein PucG [Planctomycetes bacterium Poly30]
MQQPLSAIPKALTPSRRTLMGPGPSDVDDAVLLAMARPTLGHLDPEFLVVMDQLREMMRAVFQTKNDLTMPMSGTGSAGMETCMVNLLEPGDRALIGVDGVFGTRMAEVARRTGAEVTEVKGEWGRAFTADQLRAGAEHDRYDLVAVVHAETSTGVLQPIPEVRELADDLGALLLIDCVTSLAGHAVKIDEWGVDAAYSGTQKCLSCPPGLSPVTFSPRAVEKMDRRKHKVQSWYLDLSLIRGYWGEERSYHHTAPINMLYAMHEALRLVLEEGLEARFERHARNSAALREGLAELGLEVRVPEAERLNPLTTVAIPDGVDDGKTRRFLLEKYGLEIGGGLGPMKGNTWRIGLMGAGSTMQNVTLCLAGLKDALSRR